MFYLAFNDIVCIKCQKSALSSNICIVISWLKDFELWIGHLYVDNQNVRAPFVYLTDCLCMASLFK